MLRECKACLARVRTGKASLALPAYYNDCRGCAHDD